MEALTQVDGVPFPTGTRGECIKRRLEGKGVRAIAREIGVSPQCVSAHLNHPEARRFLDEMAQAAATAARDIIAESAPAIVAKARAVALGKADASPQQVAAMRLVLGLAGLDPGINVRVSGGVDIRHTGDDALRRRLVELRGDDDGDPADGG